MLPPKEDATMNLMRNPLATAAALGALAAAPYAASSPPVAAIRTGLDIAGGEATAEWGSIAMPSIVSYQKPASRDKRRED